MLRDYKLKSIETLRQEMSGFYPLPQCLFLDKRCAQLGTKDATKIRFKKDCPLSIRFQTT